MALCPPSEWPIAPIRPGSTSARSTEHVDRPDVVPDRLHRGAGVAHGVDVDLVLAEVGIVGGDGDITPLGQLAGVVQVGVLAQPRRLVLADGDRLMQAEHGRSPDLLTRSRIGNQQPGRHAIAGLAGERDLLAHDTPFPGAFPGP